jgi:hypothetical protein
MARVCVFDVNETLLDLGALDLHFEQAFGDAGDVAGALRAGCAAAFVARPGMVLDPLVERPDVVGADLREVSDRILEAESG